MGECRPEVCPVDAAVSRGLGRVDVLAAATVELDGLFVRDVGEADGEEGLGGAEHARAFAEVGAFVFFELEGWLSITSRYCGERMVGKR